MAAGRHVKALIAAYRDRDDLAFRRAAQAIIEDEEAKRHTALARDLRRLLSAANGWVSSEPMSALVRQAPVEDGDQLGAASFFGDAYAALPEPPRDRDSGMPLAAVQVPRTTMTDLVLAEGLRHDLEQLVDEVDHWPLLDRQGIPRRNRLLLYGPPGCGKTSIASALASALGRPLVTVRVDSVVSSFLGETSSNLRKIMDFASSGAYVVLFDEFDSIGKAREDPTDHGELRRVVNAMLQLIDVYEGPSLLVAATNHSDILDDAMWRRFDEILSVGGPDRCQIEELLHIHLGFEHAELTDAITSAATELDGLPHAAVRYAANSARRRAVLAHRPVTNHDLYTAVAHTIHRRWG